MDFFFYFPKVEVYWPFLSGMFHYLVHISKNPHELESFELLPTYLGVRSSKSVANKVVVPSDPLPPSHQTTLVLQVEVGEIENSFLDLSPSSTTPYTHNLSMGLDCEFHGYAEVLSPYPPSFVPSVRLDCEFWCSLVPNLSCNLHEDQVLHEVGFEQPICDMIHDDYVWEPIAKQESMTMDDFLPSTHLLHHPDIFHDSIISI